MRAYKDPVTGEFTAPAPAPAPQMQETQRQSNVLEAPLVEHALPDGGVAVSVRGRFRSYATATKDASGKVTVGCEPVDPVDHLAHPQPH